MKPHPLIVLGAGGHAKVLIDALRLRGCEILGIADADAGRHGTRHAGCRVVGDDAAVLMHDPAEIRLVNGVGSTGRPQARRRIFDEFKQRGYVFQTVTHPSAVIAADAVLEEGAQVMAGAIIQPGVRIGMNAIVNTAACVDHDCAVGAHVHLAPGVILSGGVRIGDGTHIGTGACVIQGVTIGEECVIGAGAVVLADIPAGMRAAGVPARRMEP
jgi:UDP-perosamine 4-acetyltransferase